ncbi:MAG: XRE family transcriptional regulator [Rhodanobacter sp. 68-29]|nr:helix-turn-helix domain-containing protein [Rhodanobacter sp.]ODU73408.1 MAG: XRE family transcriptional regulator [Rhodanobacter sp. SCN 69-32]OJY57186.1 MAG: XRE family transcriptional regulator [Rhodanobacter sp. 68-29]
MRTSSQRTELKAFLRARRAALAPETAGVPRGGRRLTPGLRREEVAALAGVGLTWYTWLEQGRAINVSAAALTRIAHALSLSPTDEAYLFSLAGVAHPEPPLPPFELAPSVQLLLDRYRGPAFVLDPVFDALAWNAQADWLFGFAAQRGPFARNHVWNAFLNPARRRLYPEFVPGMLNLLGIFRMSQAAHPDDARFDTLIAALSAASPEFAELWNRQETAPLSALRLPLFHPELGPFCVHSTRLPIRDVQAEGATAFFFVPADAATGRAFERMAGLAGGTDAT